MYSVCIYRQEFVLSLCGWRMSPPPSYHCLASQSTTGQVWRPGAGSL